MRHKRKIVLCSACLLGVKSRYNGSDALNKTIIKLSKKQTLIPICPEQLGGLPTPREPVERKGNKVITKSGKDVTLKFKRGAREVLRIAKLLDAKDAILKQSSPSCGFGKIYDGSFLGKLIKGNGITADLLKRNGIRIIPDDKSKLFKT